MPGIDSAEASNVLAQLTQGLGGAELTTVRNQLGQSGLLSSLLARKAQEEEDARNAAFGSTANRGFFGGGMARTAATPALADIAYNTTREMTGEVNSILGDYRNEKAQERADELSQEQLDLQREANKPRGLFASLFGG